MQRPLLAVTTLCAMLLVAGCFGEEDPAPAATTGGSDLDPASAVNASASASGSAKTPTNATANGTTSANATASDPPSDPGNCMRGMDMPGCTAAQAEAAYQERMKNYVPPPPDKELPPIVIALDAAGANDPGAFTLEAGTMILLVDVYLNDTGVGPYLAVGPDVTGDLVLNFAGPESSATITIPGRGIGADPALPLEKRVSTRIEMPSIGDWTVTLDAHGLNAQVEIRLVERFYM